MSRSTQFVGMTAAGVAFTETLELTGRYVGAHGIASEDIELGLWCDSDGNKYREVSQIISWSSGPCIFTCLEVRWANEESPATSSEDALEQVRARLRETANGDGADINATTALDMLTLLDVCPYTLLFEWTLDPSLEDDTEWDYDRGAYWV